MIIDQVKKVLGLQLGIDPKNISDNSDIIDDLKADSLDAVEIVMELETKFKVAIEDNEYSSSRTPVSIAKLIDSKLAHS